MNITFLKSNLLFFGIQLFLFSSSYGQVKAAKPMENAGQKSQKYTLGIKFGPTFSKGHFPKNLSDTILQTHTNRVKVGYSISGQLSFTMPNSYSCLVEAGYMRGGRKVDYNNNEWQNDFTYRYITSSLALRKTFKIHLKDGRATHWFVNVGPNVAFLMSGKGELKTDNGGSTPFTLVFHNLSDSAWTKDRTENNELDKYHFNKANRFFFGADIGLGTFVKITNTQKVSIECRVTLGGTFIKKKDTKASIGGLIGGNGNNNPQNPTPDIGSFSDPLTTNINTLSINLGYTFDFDTKESKIGKSTLDKKRKSGKRR